MMGNCGRKSLSGTTDYYHDVPFNMDSQPLEEAWCEETEDEVKDNGSVKNIANEEIHRYVTANKDLEKYEDYYHIVEDDQLENYSEWDIIEFESVTPLIDTVEEEAITVDSVTPLSNIYSLKNTVAASPTPHLNRPFSRVRFSEPEGHPLYTVYENEESSVNNIYHVDGLRLYSESPTWKDRADTRSLQSYMSDMSTNSTFANFDSMLVYHLTSAQIQIHVNYDLKTWLLRAGVKQIECSLDPTFQDLRVYWQVHMTLLPFKRQKLKTKYKHSSNAIFNQAIEVKMIEKSVLNQISVRYRLYGRFGRAGRKRLAGEVVVDLTSLAKKPNHFLIEWKTFNTSVNSTLTKASLPY